MPRKNARHVKGKNGGRKFDGRDRFEPVDSRNVRYLINEDAKMFNKLSTH